MNFFKTINGCEKGDEPYIDLPKTPLPAVGAAGFGQKLIDFMAATPGPAPYLILEKATKPQYPWGTATPSSRAGAGASEDGGGVSFLVEDSREEWGRGEGVVHALA